MGLVVQPGFIPTVLADAIEVYIGSGATGQATAGSHTLSSVVFTKLPGQSVARTFTPADVGMPIAIIGGGAIDPLMPNYFVRGAMFHTTIATYVSPSEVTLVDAPVTSIFNTGFNTIVCYNRADFRMDTFTAGYSIAPGTRNTAGFTILSDSDYVRRFELIARGQPVYIHCAQPGFNMEFGGSINTLDIANQPGIDGTFAWVCGCTNWASIAVRRIVNPVNPAVYSNKDGDEVFKRLVFTNLIDEGVSVDAEAAPSITMGAPAGAYINTLLDQVVQLISTPTQIWYWDVDPWRKYILKKRETVLAPWNISDGYDLFAGSQPVQVLNSTSGDQLANFVYGIGNNVLFNSLNVTVVGDGGRTFNMPQAMQTEPVITLNGGSPLSVGILGVEINKDWYWNQGSATLTQDSGGTILSSTDRLLVRYQFTNPGIAQSPNVASLQERSNVECTSGQYDYSFSISQPILPNDLLAQCTSYQQLYGIQPQAVKLSTLRPGLMAGQLQTIVYPSAGIDGDFLISTVKISTQMQVIQWDYTAFRGSNTGSGITGLVQFINRGGNTLQLTTPVPVIGSGYLSSRAITIDHTQVPSDQVRFPLAFYGTYPWLKSAANGGNVQNANGYDIIFSTTPDGANPIPFERAGYDGSTGDVQFWVLIASLSSSTNTTLYVCWNNPQVSTDQQHPDEVWAPLGILGAQPNPNFHGVYHLSESAAPFLDSSGYGNASNGSMDTGYGVQAAGRIGKGQQFNGAQGIQLPGTVLNNGTPNTAVTFEAWVKTTQTTEGSILECMGGPGNHGAELGIQATTGLAFIGRDDGSAPSVILGTTPINDGNWHFVCGTIGGSVATDVSRLYVDGVKEGGDGAGLTVGFVNTIPTGIAQATRGSVQPYGVNGVVDEVRCLQWPLSADWIKCEFNNQKPASTFYSVGNQNGGQTVDVIANAAGTVTNSTGVLTADLPVFGNGGVDVKPGTKTGTTNKVVSASGSPGTGDPLIYDASGNATPGVPGQLVPAGGTTGQVLAKSSGTSYATDWVDPSVDDITVNGATTLNIIHVNGVELWRGQTEIQIEGVFI